jgi:hypothetical protein
MVLAPKEMTNVKCNRKSEQRAIQLQSLHTTNETSYGEVYMVIAHLQYCGLLTFCPLFSETVKLFIYH